MTRLVPLASAIWLLAVLSVSPRAAQTAAPHVPVAIPGDGALFTTSDDCVACHNNLVTAQGEDISIGTAWRSTMMANSGRDPYFLAAVRRETIDHPTAADEIQDECAACHMPMLQRTAHAAGRKANVLAQLPFGRDGGDEHALAADGVSCTVCHQITSEKLGTRESFNGGFVLAPTPPNGARPIFGPFKVDRARTTIMRSVTGFEQAESTHVRRSELCATCHTLFTEARGPDGRVIGTLPEQMNFQEWQHSAYREEKSCQSCHMPTVDTPARMSSVLGDQREGIGRHLFVGGNAFMLRMLDRYRGELGVVATPQELDATARATERQLQQDTARVSISRAAIGEGTLFVDVSIENLAGHKMPTGYPSRRAWLHLTVRDPQGRVVFESGAVESTGLIRGNDNDADATRFEPHYDEIRSAGDVQIYESVMADPSGRVTTGLLQATQFVKDNRLLPRGFDKTTAGPDIAVRGSALQDDTFTGAGDRIRYLINVGSPVGAFDVEVELRYQPIGFRWAQNLADYDAPEPRRFVSYFNSMSASSSVVLTRAAARAQ